MRSQVLAGRIKAAIRHLEDFPSPSVRFLDIGPVIADAGLFAEIIEAMSHPYIGKGVTHVLGVEARGLYFAGAVATKLGAGLVPVRKPGKLPPECLSALGRLRDRRQVVGAGPVTSGFNTYVKAYEFEISQGILGPASQVIVVDDLLAKGGSLDACRNLAMQTTARLIGASVLIELGGLEGRANLEGLEVVSLVLC